MAVGAGIELPSIHDSLRGVHPKSRTERCFPGPAGVEDVGGTTMTTV